MTERPAKLSIRRALRAIEALKGHVIEGLRLRDIAKALDAAPSTVLRDLVVLAEEGVIERIPGRDEYWRLTPKLVQIARALDLELTKHRQRGDETEQRYTRI